MIVPPLVVLPAAAPLHGLPVNGTSGDLQLKRRLGCVNSEAFPLVMDEITFNLYLQFFTTTILEWKHLLADNCMKEIAPLRGG